MSLTNNSKTVFLASPGYTLKSRRAQFMLARKGERPIRLPALLVRQFVVAPEVEVTCEAMRDAMESEIPMTFLDHTGRVLGHVQGARRHDAQPRLLQYRLYDDPARKLGVARKLVLAKLHNSLAVLLRHRKNHPEFACRDAVETIRQAAAGAAAAADLDQLRGCEGGAARAYFDVFGGMIRKNFSFAGRTRNPPLDPVNAMLSFGYTLISREIGSVLEALGLDPYVGLLHELKPGRPSLALDLVEPLRAAVVDRFVLSLINLGQVTPEHFDTVPAPNPAVYLNREGRRIFFLELEHWMERCQDEAETGEPWWCPRSYATAEVEASRRALVNGALDQWELQRLPLPE